MIYNDKERIESELGEEIEWERLDEKKSSRIAIYREGSIEDDSKILQEIKSWSIENLLKFKKVFDKKLKKHISELNKKQLTKNST